MTQYSNDELFSIYELGRMYYEMGYFAAAERIFAGLVAVSDDFAEARLGLGLVKFECEQYDEAAGCFRSLVQEDKLALEAYLGLAAIFIAQGEATRARTLLLQLEKGVEGIDNLPPNARRLWQFYFRCSETR